MNDKNEFKPKYVEFAEKLKEQILTGQWQVGEKLPTVSELISTTDYSQPTIQHAMQILVREGLVIRSRKSGTVVADWQSRGHIVPHNIYIRAPELELVKKHPYAWFVTDSITKGIISDNHGHRLKILTLNELISEFVRDDQPKAYFSLDGKLGKIGMFIKNFPYILNCRATSLFQTVNSVNYDAIISSYLTVMYLICELGHRDIAMVWGGVQKNYIDSLAGYRMALNVAKIPFRQELVFSSGGGGIEESGYQTAEDLLNSGKKFSAVFVDTDPKAVGVLQCFADKGIKVPEDVSVIGMDNVSGLSDIAGLTTLKKPFGEMGKTMLALLEKRIKNNYADVNSEMFYGTIIKRNTCAPLKSH